jgi:O-antigen ligase
MVISHSFLKIFALIILTAVCGAAIVISWQFFLIAFLALIFLIIILFWPEKAFYFLIFYIPFQIALNPIEGIDLASIRILIILLFFAWLLFSLSQKNFFIPNTTQAWLISIFLFIVFLSFCYAPEQERALRKTLFLFNIIPLYFISASIIKSKIQINKIISISIFAALFAGIIGLIQFGSQFIIGREKIANFWAEIISPIFYGESFGAQIISTPSWFVNISGETYLRSFGFFPDPHMFSFYLGLIIPLVLCFLIFNNAVISASPPVIPAKAGISFISKVDFRLCGNDRKERKNKKRIFLFIILTILITSILLSFSRGGYLGIFAGLSSVIILSWKFLIPKMKIIIFLIILTGIVAFFIPQNPIACRINSIINLEEGSNAGRLIIWQQAADVFREHPISGVGIGNYSFYLFPEEKYRTPIYAHNTYLDIASEMGIFALIAWIGIFLSCFWQLFKIIKKTADKNTRIISIGLFGGLIWFSVHCFFETPIYSPQVLAMLMIIFGMVVGVRKIHREEMGLMKER